VRPAYPCASKEDRPVTMSTSSKDPTSCITRRTSNSPPRNSQKQTRSHDGGKMPHKLHRHDGQTTQTDKGDIDGGGGNDQVPPPSITRLVVRLAGQRQDRQCAGDTGRNGRRQDGQGPTGPSTTLDVRGTPPPRKAWADCPVRVASKILTSQKLWIDRKCVEKSTEERKRRRKPPPSLSTTHLARAERKINTLATIHFTKLESTQKKERKKTYLPFTRVYTYLI